MACNIATDDTTMTPLARKPRLEIESGLYPDGLGRTTETRKVVPEDTVYTTQEYGTGEGQA